MYVDAGQSFHALGDFADVALSAIRKSSQVQTIVDYAKLSPSSDQPIVLALNGFQALGFKSLLELGQLVAKPGAWFEEYCWRSETTTSLVI
jgi:hypothetical protein